LEVVRATGRAPADIRHIRVTHRHSDHAGSRAELKRRTGAPATMRPEDAAMVRAGKALRPLTPTPGLINGILGRLVLRFTPTSIEAVEVEHEVQDGETLTTDGPYADTKEVFGGYYVFEADNLDEALELASRIPAARLGGAIEVRPVVEQPSEVRSGLER